MGIARFGAIATIIAVALAAPAAIIAQPTATPNSGIYAPGVVAITVTGGGSAADVTAVVERDSGLKVQALWMLFASNWRYYLPATPQIDGGLTLFPQTGAAYAVLDVRQPPPPPPPPPALRTITRADSGKTFTFAVGERFALNLGDNGYVWNVTVDDPKIVQSDPMILIFPPPSRTTWTAIARGETMLRATGDPPCRYATPPCLLPAPDAPTLLFSVTVIVR